MINWKIKDKVIKETIFAESFKRIVVKAANSELGLLPPYFSLLGDGITGIELVNVSDDPYLGNRILVTVATKIDLYSDQCFELAAEKAIV